MKKNIRNILLMIPVMVLAFMITQGTSVFAADDIRFLDDTGDITVKVNDTYTIIDGVYEGDLTLTKNGSSEVGAHVVLVKPDAKAKFKAIVPGYYEAGSTAETRAQKAADWKDSDWSLLGLTNMVREYESAQDTASKPVIAAINGDFGDGNNVGMAPRGSVILEGNAEMAHTNAFPDEFFFGYKDNGVLNIVQRTTSQKDDFSEALCGGAFILRNGELFGVDNENDPRQRTGIAYRTNGEVLLITVNSGISVKQLAQLMKASGCWNGINMDGGGSTAMLTRREGDDDVHRRTPDNASGYSDEDENHERRIPAGLLLVADDDAAANNVPSGNKVTTDNSTYPIGGEIRVTANTDVDGAWVSLLKAGDDVSTPSYFWYYVYGDNDGGTWCWENGATYDICSDGVCSNREGVASSSDLPPGEYKIVLLTYGDNGKYKKIADEAFFTIGDEEEDDTEGRITVSGFSRDDKIYEGIAESEKEKQRPLYEFFYGDSISATATVSGNGADAAWVGIITDEDFSDGYTENAVDDHWYWIKDHEGETVNLNYMVKNEISEGNSIIPFGFNYWVVVVNRSGKILDGAPVNYRTFNLDWNNAVWGQAAKQRITTKLEWTSSVADGTDKMPKLTVTAVDGHFGYEKDAQGKLAEITEQVLEQGRDYTVEYPAESREPGSYSIKVTFPSEQPVDESGKPSNNYYKYLSTNADNYGFADGFTYTLTEKEGQHLIHYELNGGTNNEANPDFYTEGEELVLQEPSRNGYIFEGWYTTQDFRNGTLIEKISADMYEDITVYAKWFDETAAAYKITYVLNGGTNDVKNPDRYTGKTDISLKPAMRPGYNFDGWYFDAAFTRPANVIPKGKTGDITVHAKFTKKDSDTFTISTYVSGGSISDNARVKKGSSYTVSYEPNKGYVLSSITVDGADKDIKAYSSSYTFENVSADHTISVVYSKPADEDASADTSKAVKGKTYTVVKQKYKVTKAATSKAAGTVTFTKAKNAKSVKVPSTVKIKGRTYKVTRIGAKAFAKSSAKTVTIGKNVRKIDKYAFKSSKVTKLIIKSRKLSKARVKGSLKGSKIKTVIVRVSTGKKTNKSFLTKYKKYFTKKNAGRKVTVK